MARVLIYSGAGRYGDVFHPFEETSAAAAEILKRAGHDVLVREAAEGALLDVAEFDLVVINSSADGKPHGEPWRDDHDALGRYVDEGRPILGLHTAASAFPDWSRWSAVIGGRWGERAYHPEIGLARFEPAPDAATHPIWEGRDAVEAFDERYCGLDLDNDITPLVQHGDGEVMGWVKGPRVVYDGMGHDARSYESASRQAHLVAEAAWLLR